MYRKKSKRGRGQESDEAYTDDEEEDISDVDSDDERNPSPSQGASGDDVSGMSLGTRTRPHYEEGLLLTPLGLTSQPYFCFDFMYPILSATDL